MLAPTISRSVHDPERVVAFVRAQLAMVGVIDRDQRIDAGALGGIELVLLQLPSIRRQRAEIIAHHADRRLLEVDQLDAWHGMEDVLGGLDHALEPGWRCKATRIGTGLRRNGRSRSRLPRRKSMNGVISNGLTRGSSRPSATSSR